jgi:NADH dehydrogenase [ubiquinone] 1 alpha subcomplex assembly factor 1
MSDADLGAFSTANLDFVPATASEPDHAHFHGNISIELPPNNPEVVRAGYAGWRTLDRKPTLFGRSMWDVDAYAYLALRVKSDGRKYFVNLQTDSVVPTDLHQHRLFAKKPGDWETVIISLNDFVRTNHGMVVEPQSEMLTQRVKSVGISLIDRLPKPYDLRIAKIWATNNSDDDAPGEVDEPPPKPKTESTPEKILI